MVILENTPITKLSVPGNSFYIKRDDLLPFSCGGNKVRIAYEFLADMKAKGGNCLIMYGNSRSNLCRVLASACYKEDIPCMMICSDDPDGAHRRTGNSVLVDLLGSEIIYCAKSAIAPAVDEAFRRAASRGLVPYYIYGNRLGIGNEGCAARAYAKAYDEICAQEETMGIRFDYIFHASGTGATQSGLVCGHLVRGDERTIVGISVSRDKERGTGIIKNGVTEWFRDEGLVLPPNFEDEIVLSDDYLAGGYGAYNEEILNTIRTEWQRDSICLDPTYTGKAFTGMLSYVQDHNIHDKNILFIHTGGTPLFYDALELL
jgi:D-cysteine desulfhydrase